MLSSKNSKINRINISNYNENQVSKQTERKKGTGIKISESNFMIETNNESLNEQKINNLENAVKEIKEMHLNT